MSYLTNKSSYTTVRKSHNCQPSNCKMKHNCDDTFSRHITHNNTNTMWEGVQLRDIRSKMCFPLLNSKWCSFEKRVWHDSELESAEWKHAEWIRDKLHKEQLLFADIWHDGDTEDIYCSWRFIQTKVKAFNYHSLHACVRNTHTQRYHRMVFFGGWFTHSVPCNVYEIRKTPAHAGDSRLRLCTQKNTQQISHAVDQPNILKHYEVTLTEGGATLKEPVVCIQYMLTRWPSGRYMEQKCNRVRPWVGGWGDGWRQLGTFSSIPSG